MRRQENKMRLQFQWKFAVAGVTIITIMVDNDHIYRSRVKEKMSPLTFLRVKIKGFLRANKFMLIVWMLCLFILFGVFNHDSNSMFFFKLQD